MEHFIESQQLTPDIIFDIFSRADEFRKDKLHEPVLKGKVLATLFYEPSTRTRLSFETAMLRLGGSVVTTENAKEFSSAVKGETLQDSILVVSNYADAIVIRHYEEGMAKIAASVSKVPVINAGDGKGQHPTQALLDLYTIWKETGKLDNLRIAIVGDLSSGRTARSLCYLLGKFPGNEIIFLSPEHLRMKQDIKEYLSRHGIAYREEKNLDEILPEVDIVYMTRIQKERITLDEYNSARGKYTINQNNFNLLKKSARILHPLPKIDEIVLPIEIEETDKRVAYFRQAENGLYIRMALLVHLMQ
ncbi:MAG: aspartate carbamoyltransferase [Nanoarchaeota archaeon]